MANVISQVIYDLVQADEAPDLGVRFPNFVLSSYTTITMEIRRAITGDVITRTVTPDGTDDELGTVTWQTGDLEVGDSEAEFEFTTGGKTFRLPRKFPVILRVRKKV
jgi:hypothetical protein